MSLERYSGTVDVLTRDEYIRRGNLVARECAKGEWNEREANNDIVLKWIEKAYTIQGGDKRKQAQWNSIVERLPDIPLAFLAHIIETTTEFVLRTLEEDEDSAARAVGKELDKFLPEFERNKFHRIRGNFSIAKTGSKLEARVFGKNTVFINTLSNEARNAWISAETIVPVSPFLRELPAENNKVRVVTRYCGPSINNLLQVTSSVLADNMNNSVDVEVRQVVAEIDSQLMRIAKALFDNGISHGHLHSGNFTVEFIRKSYLEAETAQTVQKEKGVWQLPSAQKLNKVPYSESDFLFSFSDYFDAEGDFVPLVRLIDFDMAKVLLPKPSVAQWLAKEESGISEWRLEELLEPLGLRSKIKDRARGLLRKIITSITFGRAIDGGVRMTVEQENSDEK